MDPCFLQTYFNSHFFDFQSFMAPPPIKFNDFNESMLILSPYQTQYAKNLNSLKSLYKQTLCENISAVFLTKLLCTPMVERRWFFQFILFLGLTSKFPIVSMIKYMDFYARFHFMSSIIQEITMNSYFLYYFFFFFFF